MIRTCAICGDKMLVAKVLSSSHRMLIFLKRGVFIPPGSRCCPDHLVAKQLTIKSFGQVRASKPDRLTVDSVGFQVLLDDMRSILHCQKSFNFDDPASMNDEAYKTVVGLSKGSSL